MMIKLDNGCLVDSMAVRVYEEILGVVGRVSLLDDESLHWLQERLGEVHDDPEPGLNAVIAAFRQLCITEIEIQDKNGGAPCPPPKGGR
jgi:hypothetical protein